MQILFQWDIHGNTEYWLKDFWTQHPAEPDVQAFAERLAEGVMTHHIELDRLIGAQAVNWKISRMPIVDRNILRAALHELLFLPDVPAKVTVNEAIELAKRFADEDTKKFVNGILDRILREDPRLEEKRAQIEADAATSGAEPNARESGNA